MFGLIKVCFFILDFSKIPKLKSMNNGKNTYYVLK